MDDADKTPMGWRQNWEPRDRDVASRTAAGFTCFAAVTQIAASLLVPPQSEVSWLLAYGVPLALIGLAGMLLKARRSRLPLLWTAVPILGLVTVVALDLGTRDASVAGQVFIFFPVLYAASQLRRMAAATIAALAVVSEAIVTLSIEPLPAALNDLGYVAAALTAMTILLLHGAQVQEQLVIKLREQAMVDPLTGLVTRRVLDEATRGALTVRDRADRRAAGPGTSLIVLDIDLFKAVNDTHGHPVGDDLLVHLASILRAECRPGDVISRLGGDELAVLMPECSYSNALQRGAQLVRAVRHTPMSLPDGGRLSLSISAGVGHVSRATPAEPRALYSLADAALYQAKRNGRDRVAPSPDDN
jgi:diguanylate cyclase (GGDEF)-like protein